MDYQRRDDGRVKIREGSFSWGQVVWGGGRKWAEPAVTSPPHAVFKIVAATSQHTHPHSTGCAHARLLTCGRIEPSVPRLVTAHRRLFCES